MSINKSEKNLKQFQYSITKVINIFISASLGIFVVFYLSILFLNNKKDMASYEELLSNTNKLLQANISSQLATIANSPDFIRYIQSGEVTRSKYTLSIKWLFANLDYRLIKGVIITDKNNKLLLQYGEKTSLFTNLNVCYLENRVNANMGDCKCSLLIYFNIYEYMNQLHKLNNKILLEHNNHNKNILFLNPFNSDFGVFFSLFHSSTALKFHRKFVYNPILLVLIIIPLIGFIITLILSNKYLKKKITNDLILPTQNLINMLHGSHIPLKQSNIISEFNELIDVVNQYNNQRLNNQLNEIVASVVHDIRSPLTVIDFSSAEIMGNNHPKRLIIKKAIKTIKSIVDNMLVNYTERNTNNTLSKFDNEKTYLLMNELIEEIVEQKYMEWSKDTDRFSLVYDFINLNYFWVFLSATEFKRHMSNLLNNSFEAIQDNYIKIKIEVSNINNFICILIKDNGIGLTDSQIVEIKSGKSFKENGHGIGLKNAKNYFENEGGELDITSVKGKCTKLEIHLKTREVPQWFTNVLIVNINLVIIDDDDSVLLYWVDKLSKTDRKITTLNSPKKFKEWHKDFIPNPNYTFFIDYDYNDEINGIDIIKEINFLENCYLITNSYNDIKIQEQVSTLNIKMLPKFLLPNVSLILKNT